MEDIGLWISRALQAQKEERMDEPIGGTNEVCSLQDVWGNEASLKPSAVLVPIFEKQGRYHLLFTRRTQMVEYHKGEVSFPGGAKDEADDSLLETALRETEEEIGIPPSEIRMLGTLSDVYTIVSKFVVRPYVGIIPHPFEFRINSLETEEIVEIPLDFFYYERRHWEDIFEYQEKRIKSHFFEWRKDVIVWGVTAQIVKNFCNILKQNLKSDIVERMVNG